MTQPDETEQAIEAKAAEWVIRLGGDPLAEAERRELDCWLARSADHRDAFEFARTTWTELGELRHAPGSLKQDLPVPIRGHGTRRATAGRGTGSWIRAGAIAASVLVAIGLGLFWIGDPVIVLTADYSTAPGQQRTIFLPDGSTVELGSGSAIALHFNDTERRVELLSGVAFFQVAPKTPMEARPFVVEGSNGTVTALGTAFAVGKLSESVDVIVAEHEVEVALQGGIGSFRSQVVLSPGQSVRYSPREGLGAVRERDPELATAWRRGRLIFDQVPLADAIAELNRYRRGQIVIADSSLASLPVSGVFDTHDLDNALVTIARELGAKTASMPPLVTLLY